MTYLHAEGAYTGDPRKVVFTVITRVEEAKLKEVVIQIDPNAFLSFGNVSEVRGGHHRKKKIH